MSRDPPRMPAPVAAAAAATAVAATARFSKQNELLSPTSSAVVYAAEQRAAKPGHVVTGALRVIVIQVADLPGTVSTNGVSPPSPSPSWLRRKHRDGHKAKAAASANASSCGVFDSVCVLLKIGVTGRTLATSGATRGESVCWNEEFLFDNVTTTDELRLVCIDRAKNEPYFTIPLRCDDSITSSPGFIGKVHVPLIRLPEGEDIEQWYSLVPKEAYLSLRTALRVSICFTPVGGRARSTRAESSVMVRQRPPPLTMTQGIVSGNGAMHMPPSPLGTTPQPISMNTGIIDYAIVVGPQDADYSGENTLLFRYPAADRAGFPLPTKVEWFCFPGGPEVVEQVQRPASKLFSFILVGSQDGLSRCYAVCVMVYHRARHGPTNVWQATCISFLTRIPLLHAVTACLLSFSHTWIASATMPQPSSDRRFEAERLLVDLCYGVLTPVRGVLGVEFALPTMGRLKLELHAETTIYHTHSHANETRGGIVNPRIAVLGRTNGTSHHSRGATSSPTKTISKAVAPQTNASDVRVQFQPLVYSLAPLFQHFDVKSIVEIMALMLCEYRLLIHSTQMSVLTPIAEGLCALIYPLRWQHPYVPILPSVLCEYLQAPLPYILGVDSSWLPELLENGRPEHLVIVDIDRGSIQRHDSGPVLPPRLTRALRKRVHHILHPDDGDEMTDDHTDSRGGRVPWSERIERLVRGEFVCFLATMLKGYRDCLFFVNQNLPVFNKRRFFASYAADNEATPFLTRLFCTQAFQAFLENHDAAELIVFHAVHVALLRGSETIAWPHSCPPCLESSCTNSLKRLPSWRAQAVVKTPIYRMNSDLSGAVEAAEASGAEQGCREDGSDLQPLLGVMLERELDKTEQASELLCMRGGGGLSVEAMDARYAELMNRTLDYHMVADGLGVDAKVLEDYSEWLKRPHELNQRPSINSYAANGHGASSTASLATSIRALSKDEERMEQLIHKCLTSIFTSDEQLSAEETRQCEARFKSQYARDLFVLILMQPSQQYVDNLNVAVASAWYNPKGSGSCIGESGFQLLLRMSIAVVDQCAIHEDFTNARGMLQVAAQYYHFVEDKHSGIGVAKKEYLVHSLRARPICRSLDMWQHAFSKEIDAVLLSAGDSAAAVSASLDDADAAACVSDEMFFSVVGSLIYDMLSVDVPVGNVQTFVTVMCSTYQKDRELRDTLKQLVENVCRAVEMSKDSAPQPTPITRADVTSSSGENGNGAASAAAGLGRDVSPAGVGRPQYDLDTVIRRKMSVQDGPLPPLTSRRPPPPAPMSSRAHGRDGDKRKPDLLSPSSIQGPQRWRGASTAAPATTTVLLGRQRSPVLSLSVHHGRVACGVTDPLIALMDAMPSISNAIPPLTKLDGHTDAVVAVQVQGQTLISGSRDCTLRAWDLKASPKKRTHLFGFLSSTPSAHDDVASASASSSGSFSGEQIDGAYVSRKSLVMKGHTGAVTCLEIGRQLSTDRAIVASGSMDATIRLWDTSKEHSVAVLGSSGGGSRPGVSCLRYLAHFDILVSGSRDESALKSWDMATSKIRASVPAHRGSIRDIQITGERLVTAANDRVAKVWDARFRDGASFSHALRGHGGPVLCLSLGGPADPNICTGSADGIVRVWDLRYVQKGPRLALAGHQGPVSCLQRDFTRLVSGSEDGSLRVWDMHSGVCLKEARAHQSGVTCMALQDASVYSGSWDGSVRVWDIEVAGR